MTKLAMECCYMECCHGMELMLSVNWKTALERFLSQSHPKYAARACSACKVVCSYTSSRAANNSRISIKSRNYNWDRDRNQLTRAAPFPKKSRHPSCLKRKFAILHRFSKYGRLTGRRAANGVASWAWSGGTFQVWWWQELDQCCLSVHWYRHSSPWTILSRACT